MHVKTYTGTNSQELLSQIKTELGPEAVILGNRSFRKDGVRCHEVTAGVERALFGNGGGNGNASFNGQGRTGTKAKQAPNANPQLEQVSNILQAAISNGHANMGGTPPGWTEWHKEWLQIKEHLFALMKPSIQMDRLSPRQRVALEYLQREGVSDIVALELYKHLLSSPGASVLESLGTMVPVRTWGLDAWRERIHVISGPFGVGKTTSAIRMALALRRQKTDIVIAFINADCHRASGRLMLRHWAELSDFSCYEAPDAGAMRKALSASAGADKVFIDLPALGREETLEMLKARLGLGDSNAPTHLVMSPHHDSMQISAFLARYEVHGAGSLVWSKLDEAVSYGGLVNVAAACKMPISSLSHGPGLQRTLSPATEPLLWRLIFKRQLPSETPSSMEAPAVHSPIGAES
ncbi:MAG: flagellar biosynthesis protein FlhF [Desulfovibrionaceae bacterium]